MLYQLIGFADYMLFHVFCSYLEEVDIFFVYAEILYLLDRSFILV